MSALAVLRYLLSAPVQAQNAQLAKMSSNAPAGTEAVWMGHMSDTELVLPISMWLEDQDGTVCGTELAEALRFKQALPPSLSYYMN